MKESPKAVGIMLWLGISSAVVILGLFAYLIPGVLFFKGGETS